MRLSRALVFGLGGLLVAGATAADDAGSADGVLAAAARTPGSCTSQGGSHAVRRPTFVRRIATGETRWFSSPSLVDLNGDGRSEIVAPFYSTFVFDAKGHSLGKGTATKGRVYAPGVA